MLHMLGGPSGTRTQDILLKSSILTRADPKITEAMLVLKDCLRQSFVGSVAVNYCRQTAESIHASHALSDCPLEYGRRRVAASASSFHQPPARSNAATGPGIRG